MKFGDDIYSPEFRASETEDGHWENDNIIALDTELPIRAISMRMKNSVTYAGIRIVQE